MGVVAQALLSALYKQSFKKGIPGLSGLQEKPGLKQNKTKTKQNKQQQQRKQVTFQCTIGGEGKSPPEQKDAQLQSMS